MARNIHAFLSSPPDPQRDGGWWIVDEASMVSTRHWTQLVDRADQTGATIIAVGDPAQLGAVEPGGLFAALVDDGNLTHNRLGTVRRMAAPWEREASLRLRVGDPTAIDVYTDHDRVRSSDDLSQLLLDMVAATQAGQDVLLLDRTNWGADWLNDQIQNLLFEGRDPTDETVLEWTDPSDGRPRRRTIGVGDRVRTRLNAYQLVTSARRPVLNGSTWTATAITADGLHVQSDEGRGQVLLPTHYLNRLHPDTGRPTVELGWAATAHSGARPHR